MGVILRYKDFIKTYKTRGYRIKHLENYKHLFPIKSSITLSGIVADLICDGNLQGDPKWRIDFTSKSIEELKRFEKEIMSLFNVKCKIRECKSNLFGKTYNISMNCSPIARILFLCGVPSGQKVLKNFDIPKWIKSDKKNFGRFAQRVFSCEGGIMFEKHRKMPQVRMEMWKSEALEKKEKFVKELGIYLKKHFGIISTITKRKVYNVRKDGIITRPTKMYIHGENVKIFRKEIGFEGEKQLKLNNILNNIFIPLP